MTLRKPFRLDESGTRFYQHYEILTRADGSRWELGRGAMGVTYKARDINLDTPVALKIINAHFSARPDARRRFLHEAQAAARLRHPNVASVFHFGTINAVPAPGGTATTAEENADAGDCFYAMEFIEGETLEERLRRTGPLTPALALEVGLQVARALAAAEHRGLVHRDLKPSNIMLAAEAEKTAAEGVLPDAGEAWVKVIDFGLAKLCDKTEQTSDGFLWNGGVCQPGANPNPRGRRSFGYLLLGRNALVLPDRKSSFFQPLDQGSARSGKKRSAARRSTRGARRPRVCHRAP